MADFQIATRDAKVGSNLKARKKLAAADAALLERRLKPFRAAERQLQRQQRAILTRPVLRNAAEIVRQHVELYNQAFVTARGSGVKIEKARQRARAAINRALRASTPRFAEHEALLEQHQRNHQALVATHLLTPQAAALDFALGAILLPEGIAFQQFRPPFELFDAQDRGTSALPKSGIVVIDVGFQHFAPRFPGGFNPTRSGDHRSAVGVNFRVPQTGFLTGIALIQNLFARFDFAVLDNLGFSSAELDVVHTIFVAIIRSGEVTRFERIVFANGLVSHGADVSFTKQPILDSGPFTIGFKHKDPFLKGEQIQILAGANVFMHSRVDDMDGFMHARAAWQVKRLSLGISSSAGGSVGRVSDH